MMIALFSSALLIIIVIVDSNLLTIRYLSGIDMIKQPYNDTIRQVSVWISCSIRASSRWWLRFGGGGEDSVAVVKLDLSKTQANTKTDDCSNPDPYSVPRGC